MDASMANASSSSEMTAETSSSQKKIVIGVCAMKRKAQSKPMREIMAKILEYYQDWLEFRIFPEELILSEPIERWPLCDCLISFHATDFPLQKAMDYERLRRPYVINDLHRQYDLLDRRKVFRTLARAGIEHPRHGVLVRSGDGTVEGELVEHNDHIEVNGMIFNKPFVEKPLSAEDHNVYIYYPSSVGGGSQRLFRKINNRASWYSPNSTVRHEGSFIYEDFIPADGTDVKVYAVGPYYAHAEARKAPGLDGKVDRDHHGKEVRYPVILTSKEKMLARRVVMAFGQTVCGFDLLRANGKSYVCDVNGFSFVKTSTKYYEDTAKILGNMILRRLASSLSIPWQIPFQADDPPLVSTPSGKLMELRCVLAVIRHGDRTPKQKMKMVVQDERVFQLFRKYGGVSKQEIKMKRPTQLMEVLELARQILHEQQVLRNEILKNLEVCEERATSQRSVSGDCMNASGQLEQQLEVVDEAVKKWEQIRTVLEMYGHFSGINRKVQLKYLKSRAAKSLDSEEQYRLQQGSALVLILKWGGELTTAGVLQAEALGKLFRTLYPGIRRTDGKGSPEDTQGLGFLRLHSTYRHDLKMYASDEGRVQMTAAAFAKGLLALEGELTPILMQMVKSANTDGLLNDDCSARQFQSELKCYLHSALQVDRDWTAEDYENLNPSGLRSIANALEFIKNPRKMCHEIAGYVQRMCNIIHWHKLNKPHRSLYLNESWDLAERRWSKELRDFRRISKTGEIEFDISKIPDIYDNIKYDMEHNPDLCINNEGEFERMYLCVKNMADIVVPQEYGIREDSKICVAQRVCSPLLAKIRSDLRRCIENQDEDESQTRLDPRASQGIATPLRHVRTRLYFTSESHIHTLMNLIRYGGLCSVDDKKWQRAMNFLSGVTEFNYMTQVVMMVYEDTRADSNKSGEDRFHIELLFSPGLYPCFQTEKERIYEGRFGNCKPVSHIAKVASAVMASMEETPTNGSNASLSSMCTVAGGDQPICESPPTAESTVLTEQIPLGEKKTKRQQRGEQQHAEHGDSEDDLTDCSTVNLVVLDEVTAKQYNKLVRSYEKSRKMSCSYQRRRLPVEGFAEDGDQMGRHSPVPGRRKRHKTGDRDDPRENNTMTNKESSSGHVGIMKSMSEIACSTASSSPTPIIPVSTEEFSIVPLNYPIGSGQLDSEESDNFTRRGSINAAMGDDLFVGELDELDLFNGLDEVQATICSSSNRRSRFPYRFKHHTVNLLTEVDNRLISTDVLMGKCNVDPSDSTRRRMSTMLSTAVIARSSSAPRLQTYKAEDEIAVGEIRRFWPPLRSLETMHDNLSLKQVDQFLERLMVFRTPIPSPPRTPGFDTVTPSLDGSLQSSSSESTLRDTVRRLRLLQQ